MSLLVLGIESTCDETACALVRDGKEILSQEVASQADLQSIYGGVVPELASRRHIDVIIPTIQETLKKAAVALCDVDAIAVAQGPGLIGPLLIGTHTAQTLAWALNKPLIGVNHIEAHLYASLMGSPSPCFPSLGVVISGGHTALVQIDSIGSYSLIGQTVDDALGEAFDKVAKVLGLPYPGGPEIEREALKGDESYYLFKAGNVKGRPYHFSFSGLKTAVLYAVKGQKTSFRDPIQIKPEEIPHVAASFQRAAFEDLLSKIEKAVKVYQPHALIFGGGVCANQKLRKLVAQQIKDVPVLWPTQALSLDNAAMIAGLAYHHYPNRCVKIEDLKPQTRMTL